jgi:hypothetical protein
MGISVEEIVHEDLFQIVVQDHAGQRLTLLLRPCPRGADGLALEILYHQEVTAIKPPVHRGGFHLRIALLEAAEPPDVQGLGLQVHLLLETTAKLREEAVGVDVASQVQRADQQSFQPPHHREVQVDTVQDAGAEELHHDLIASKAGAVHLRQGSRS